MPQRHSTRALGIPGASPGDVHAAVPAHAQGAEGLSPSHPAADNLASAAAALNLFDKDGTQGGEKPAPNARQGSSRCAATLLETPLAPADSCGSSSSTPRRYTRSAEHAQQHAAGASLAIAKQAREAQQASDDDDDREQGDASAAATADPPQGVDSLTNPRTTAAAARHPQGLPMRVAMSRTGSDAAVASPNRASPSVKLKSIASLSFTVLLGLLPIADVISDCVVISAFMSEHKLVLAYASIGIVAVSSLMAAVQARLDLDFYYKQFDELRPFSLPGWVAFIMGFLQLHHAWASLVEISQWRRSHSNVNQVATSCEETGGRQPEQLDKSTSEPDVPLSPAAGAKGSSAEGPEDVPALKFSAGQYFLLQSVYWKVTELTWEGFPQMIIQVYNIVDSGALTPATAVSLALSLCTSSYAVSTWIAGVWHHYGEGQLDSGSNIGLLVICALGHMGATCFSFGWVLVFSGVYAWLWGGILILSNLASVMVTHSWYKPSPLFASNSGGYLDSSDQSTSALLVAWMLVQYWFYNLLFCWQHDCVGTSLFSWRHVLNTYVRLAQQLGGLGIVLACSGNGGNAFMCAGDCGGCFAGAMPIITVSSFAAAFVASFHALQLLHCCSHKLDAPCPA